MVLACFNMMIPHLMPELPEEQREALAKNVKAPLVYANVLVQDWKPWVKLKTLARQGNTSLTRFSRGAMCGCGGTGRRAGFKNLFPKGVSVRVRPPAPPL